MPPGTKVTYFMVWNLVCKKLSGYLQYIRVMDCSIKFWPLLSPTTIASWWWRPCKPTMHQARKLPMGLKQYGLLYLHNCSIRVNHCGTTRMCFYTNGIAKWKYVLIFLVVLPLHFLQLTISSKTLIRYTLHGICVGIVSHLVLLSPNTVTTIFHTTFRERCNHILHYPKFSKKIFHVVGWMIFNWSYVSVYIMRTNQTH